MDDDEKVGVVTRVERRFLLACDAKMANAMSIKHTPPAEAPMVVVSME